MRYALALAVAALVAPAALRAEDPPITFQTQPLNRVLDDFRAAADLIGGEKAVKAVNAAIKDKLGEKGFQGLDLERPVVGYVLLAPKPEDITAVVAIPFTNEKDFLALCDRFNGFAPKELEKEKGVYQLPALDPRYKARMRFSERYAYISYGAKPEPALDPKALVPPFKLIDPADQAVVSAKLHFDRLTPAVKLAIPTYVEEIKKELGWTDGFRLPGMGQQEAAIFKPLTEEVEKMLRGYVVLLGGADTATLKLNLDVGAGDLSVEAALKGKPDTALTKLIAARKPTANKFAGLLTADTVAGFKTRLPLFNDELKTGAAKALEEGQKLAQPGPNEKAFVDEIFKGLIRTVKAGEVDVVGGIRGPDKNGDFTVVGAGAFEDTAALAKEWKAFVQKDAPADEQERFKWDADKLDNVAIHTYRLNGRNAFFNVTKPFGDDNCLVAYAFAPKGVFVVAGPDPIPVLKDALKVKPVEAPVLDVVLNPAKVAKFVEKSGGRPLDVERALGKEDKLLSAVSLKVSGGAELNAKFTLNMRLLPKALFSTFESTEKSEVVPPK